MKLIADSGATKTQWALVDDTACSAPLVFTTGGINPAVMTQNVLESTLTEALSGIRAHSVSEIRFYGAGCLPEICPAVENVIAGITGATDVEVASDMLGAARALFGRAPGIAAILGTGSNSCSYDGKNIVANTPPLGYVLGDEGSGARLGIALLNGVLKGYLPRALCRRFADATGLDKSAVIERVYRRQAANAFLASLVPFIADNIADPSIEGLVRNEFRLFFERNIISAYTSGLPVGFVGSIAVVFERQLRLTAESLGVEISRIVRHPLPLMIEFHKKN